MKSPRLIAPSVILVNMRVTLEDGLRALDEAAEQARSIVVELDEEYLRHIAMVEAMPANQPGSDKTWVWEAEEAFHAHYRNARQV